MSSCIYARLAVTNIRNNKKTYVPFLLTSVLTVMMYYIMDSLARSRDIGNQNVTTILMLALGILILFSVIFLFYTNSFLIKRRKTVERCVISWAWGKGTSQRCSPWRRSSSALRAWRLGSWEAWCSAG